MSPVPEAFYLPDGDRFIPTDLTRGPWSADAQHAGPPAALLGRAIERLEPADEMAVARFTLEVLRPVPLRPLRVDTRVVRPGRRVQLAQAVLAEEEAEIARASAWRIRPVAEALAQVDLDPLPFPGPDESPPAPAWTPPWGDSYFTAIEWRSARGSWAEPGPTAMWMRLRFPVVAGEEISALDRVLTVADSGNGISWVVDMATHLFVNTELTVHLVRPAAREWVCLDARTRLGPQGIGVAESVLWDERGRFGSGAQSLLVAPRG